MLTIGQRLLKERERLGLEKKEMASIGGVSRVSQSSYESDKTSPNGEYLVKVSKIGVDVNYVLFGSSKEVSPDDYGDDFLDTVELKVKKCEEYLKGFESSLEDIQNALSVVKKK